MAFRDPKKPIIATRFATDVPPNQRIEINDPAFPNSIAFYSGLATEETPALIEPGFDGTASTLAIRGQITDAGNSEPKTIYKSETLANGGTTSVDTQADHINLLADSIVFTSKFGASNPGVWMPNGTVFEVIDEIWHVIGAAGEPAFNSTWSGVGSFTPQFRKQPDGDIMLQGSFAPNGAAVNSNIFTLPVGYRPITTMAFAAITSAGGAERVVITSAGVVNISAGGSTVQNDILVRFSTLA